MVRQRTHSERSATRRVAGSGRGAFTLLEVLLALGLSLLLLGALNLALDLYRQYTTVGRDDIEQSQLARAILQKMAADIRCAVAPPKSGSAGGGSSTSGGSSTGGASTSGGSSSSGGASSGGSQSSSSTGGTSGTGSGSGSGSEAQSTEFQIVDPSAAYTKQVVGVVGDLQTVVLNVCRTSRPVAELPTDPLLVAAPRGDMKSVSYFLAADGADGVAGAVAEQQAVAGAASSSGGLNAVRGLARLEGDRLTIAKADENSMSDTLALHSKLIAPEVQALQFRYSDGIEWFETWDGTLNGLPRAIEVTIGLPTGEAKKSLYDPNDPTIEYYRLVVAIPAAEMPPTDSGL
jgi:hypothetical protein